ncbi:NB-ARC domain protein [Nocardiopsis alba]|uniref:NB-ARC domain protein n=1 Tax=Nocardiopsis alba TaxID=53437 RepID=UPI0035DBB6BD
MSDPQHHNQVRDNQGNAILARDIGHLHLAPPEPPPPPRRVPEADLKHVNRFEELTFVETLAGQVLQHRKGALALLSGREGIGKSATLAEAAHRVLDRFEEGSLYVDLRRWRDQEGILDLAGVLRSLLRDLHVHDLREETDVALLRDRLRGVTGSKRLLLLLDGVADDAELDALTLGAGPHLVVAACEPGLDSLGAWVSRGAEHLPLDVFHPRDSLALLRSFRRVGRRMTDPDEYAAAERLVELCGHLPGVVRMAAAQLEVQEIGVAELVEAIDERRRAAIRPLSGAEIVVDIVLSGVGPDERRLLELLSAHPGRDFSEELARTLLGEQAPETLERLADASLLHTGTRGDRRLVELVRERVRDGDNEHRSLDAAAILRFYTVTHHLADRAMLGERYRLAGELATAELTLPQRDYRAPFTTRGEAMEWQDAQLFHVPDLMTMALELGEPTAVPLLADAVWPTCYGRRRLTLGLWIYHRALEVARHLRHDGAIVRCANYLARMYVAHGMAERALPLVKEAERAAERSDDERHRAVLLETLGLLKGRSPHLEGLPEEESTELFARARDIHRDAGLPRGEAVQTYQLGDQARRSGDLTKASRELGRAERIADRRLEELESAEPTRESRWIAEDWRLLRARIRLSLARVLARSGQGEEAETKAESALEVFIVMAEPVKQVETARFLAELEYERGAVGRALERLRWAGTVAGHHHLEDEAGRIERDFARYTPPT